MGLDRELDTKIGTACPKLDLALDKKLKCCAEVLTVITNIINSFGAEIGAVLVSKLGSILGIALRTELGTALRELCTIVDIKLDVEIKLGSKVWTVLDRELCTVAVDIKLGSKLGTILDRGHRTVVVNIKLGSKLGTMFDFKVGWDSSLDTKLGSLIDNKTLKCRVKVNIVANSISSELGVVLGLKLGTVLGTGLEMEMCFKLGT
jgi:hypothetical protein